MTLFVLILGILLAFLNVVHVILPAFKTPVGTHYLATGHYFPDYFGMLSFINQGAAGEWRAYNLFTPENFSGFWLTAWPYLLLGKITRAFSLLPQVGYWGAVFLLSLLAILLAYRLATLCFKKQKQLILPVFLVYLFSGPFFRIENLAPFKLSFYWVTWFYHTVLFDRLSGVPHYLLASIFILLIFITSHYYFEKQKTSLLLALTILFGLVLFLTPIKITYLFPAFSLVVIIKRLNLKDLINLAIMGIALLLFGLILKADIAQNYFPAVKAWEESKMEFPILKIFLLGSGPTLVLAVLFLPYFFRRPRKVDPTIFLGLLATIFSYILFFTKFSLLFGNHNSRLLLPEGYFFFACILLLSLDDLATRFKLHRANVVWIATLFLVIFSLPPVYLSLKQRINYISEVPMILQYPPDEVVAGFNFIRAKTQRQAGRPHEVVLASKEVNLILPIFADTKTYATRELTSPDYDKKDNLMFQFYQGRMDSVQASDFLRENNFKYIVLTMYDEWDNRAAIFTYPPFLTQELNLKPVFANSKIKIFKITP